MTTLVTTSVAPIAGPSNYVSCPATQFRELDLSTTTNSAIVELGGNANHPEVSHLGLQVTGAASGAGTFWAYPVWDSPDKENLLFSANIRFTDFGSFFIGFVAGKAFMASVSSGQGTYNSAAQYAGIGLDINGDLNLGFITCGGLAGSSPSFTAINTPSSIELDKDYNVGCSFSIATRVMKFTLNGAKIHEVTIPANDLPARLRTMNGTVQVFDRWPTTTDNAYTGVNSVAIMTT